MLIPFFLPFLQLFIYFFLPFSKDVFATAYRRKFIPQKELVRDYSLFALPNMICPLYLLTENFVRELLKL
jgi:hypothetical protein